MDNQYQLTALLHDLEQPKGQSIEEFVSIMQAIWNQMSLSEPQWSCSKDAKKFSHYQEKTKSIHLLRALHKDYEPIRASLLSRKNFPTLDEVIAELLSEETRLSILEDKHTQSNVDIMPLPKNSAVLQSVESCKCRDFQTEQNKKQKSESMVSEDHHTKYSEGGFLTSSKKFHWSHPDHPLEFLSKLEYTCNGCKMEGMGWRYRCEVCDFDLHPECMLSDLDRIIKFRGNDIKFLEEPWCKETRNCDACAKSITGFNYHCPENQEDFHPQCAKLQSQICVGDVKFTLQEKGPSKCHWCKKKCLNGSDKKIEGWSYVCKDECDLQFHVYCVMEMGRLEPSSKKLATGEEELCLALNGKELPLKTKYKGINRRGGCSKCSKRSKWVKILSVFFNTVLSILLGDPTTLLVSTLAHIFTQVLFQSG